MYERLNEITEYQRHLLEFIRFKENKKNYRESQKTKENTKTIRDMKGNINTVKKS